MSALESVTNNTGLIAVAAGVVMGLCGVSTAWAEAQIGIAAMGALAEKESLFGKALILTVIPETIVIFGMLVAILIIRMAG